MTNSNETYCTFTLANDVTAGGLPSEEEIAKDLESNDASVSTMYTLLLVSTVVESTCENDCCSEFVVEQVECR